MLLVLLNGLLSGTEIAVISVRKTRLQELADEGRGAARAAQALRANPERFLATVQVGITVIGAAAGAFGGRTIAARLSPIVAQVPLLLPYADQLAFALVVAFISYLTIVLGELVPKSLALRAGESYALLVSRPMMALARLSRPVVWFLTSSSNLVLRLFGDRTSFTESRLSVEELLQLVGEASQAGTLDPRAGRIALRALEFADLTAADAMVPRNRVVALQRNATPLETRRVLLEEGHSRLPVYEDTIDNVVGYIAVKDLIEPALSGKAIDFARMLRAAYFVPETMRAVSLLEEMRSRRTHLAIVVDEVGGLSGIVTLEDLVEELVGEIVSERGEAPPLLVRPQRDGSFVVLGVAPIRDVNREAGLNLPEGDGWTTVAGLCISLAGQIPEKGARLNPDDGTTIEILEASSRRVRLVRIVPGRPAEQK